MSEATATELPAWRPFSWWPDGVVVLLLVLGSVSLVCSTINHYGLTYDEGWYLSKSQLAREWTGLLFSDPGTALSAAGIERYWYASRKLRTGQVMDEQQPGAPKLVDGLLGYPLGRLFGAAFPERAGTALFFAATLAALYLFLSVLWGRTVGVFGALALACLPRVFADAHLCTLDVPVMSAVFGATVLTFFAALRRSLPLALAGGLVWGVGLSCKINAVFVPLVLGAWLLWRHRDFALRAALALLGGGVVGFLGTWPWLWRDTLPRLGAYLAFHVRHYPVGVSYFGHISAHQPWHYPLVMAALTTPVLTLALGVVGLGCALRLVARRPGTEATPERWRRSQATLILLGALVNIGFNSLPSAPKYGGVRLFLPFFPFAVALSALGLHLVLQALSRARALAGSALLTPRRLRIGLVCLALLPAVRSVGLSHPYQLSYYNFLVGGTRGAVAAGMEATYWGDSYLAGASFVSAHLAPGDQVWVDLPGCEWIIRQYLEPAHPGVVVTSSGWPPERAAWALVQNKITELTPASRALLASATPRFTATLDDVPLCLVYDGEGIRRALAQKPPDPARHEGPP